MSETRATPNVPQLRLTHIFAFTFAVALVLSIPIAIAMARGTYQQAIGSLQPQTAAFFVFDAIAKAGAVCGLFALAIHRYKGIGFPTHPAEYLWILLGAVVASQVIRGLLVYSLDDFVYLIGGITAAWLCRDTRWKWFYLLVAFIPLTTGIVAFMTATTFLPASVPYFYGLPALEHLTVSSVLILYIIGTRLTWSGWAGVVTQLSLTGVKIAFFLLMFFDLWQ